MSYLDRDASESPVPEPCEPEWPAQLTPLPPGTVITTREAIRIELEARADAEVAG